MVIKTIPTTEEVEDILSRYDINKLLKTVPDNYDFSILNKIKPKQPTVTIEIAVTEETITYLNSIVDNYNNISIISIPTIITFLIENVCDCGKIQTKKVSRALDNYYEIVAKAISNQDQNARRLFSRLLNEYSESPFYDEQRGLCEKDIADFLTISQEGRTLVNDMELYNKQ